MSIPDGITRDLLIGAIAKIRSGEPNLFAPSTGYDVLYKGRRYPPKAVVGVAASKLTGMDFGPYDFKGGRGSKCFRILQQNGFEIVTKSETGLYPDEADSDELTEGGKKTVTVNRYERDLKAREECIKHYGVVCHVCKHTMEDIYGAVGEGFIHVHHLVQLSDICKEYVVDPIRDLRPLCPNCHAMLHRKRPPYTIKEMFELMNRRSK